MDGEWIDFGEGPEQKAFDDDAKVKAAAETKKSCEEGVDKDKKPDDFKACGTTFDENADVKTAAATLKTCNETAAGASALFAGAAAMTATAALLF